MKVLQVIHDFLPKHQAGSELYCFHLSLELKKLGHDVRMFYSEIDHEQPSFSVRRGEYQGLPFWEMVNNHGYRNFEETYLNPQVDNAFSQCLDEFKPDVVHYQHLLGLSYGCVEMCKERGIPVVYTLHDYWLTCPRGGGQRFRGEGMVCNEVDSDSCASCISGYSFGASKGRRLVKKVLALIENRNDDGLISVMRKGRIEAPKRSFVKPGQCIIEGDGRDVIFSHPPASISFKCDVGSKAVLTFAVAMDPGTYEQSGDGVRFIIRCDEVVVYDRCLNPKQKLDDRGWHDEIVSLEKFVGEKRRFVFETQAYPSGVIDFCTACWAEPKLVCQDKQVYRESITSKFQKQTEGLLNHLQHRPLKRQAEKRRHRTLQLFDDVDLFIAPSKFLREKFVQFGMKPDKIIFSDYGINTQGYNSNYQKPEAPIRFTFIGTLVVHKGLHVLIEAFNRLPQDSAILNVYGDTGEFTDYVKRIKSMIGHPGVRLKGRAENHEIPEILAQTDALIVPSIWFENSPITIHEAFLAQTPVITSRFGGMADLVQDDHNGILFKMGDADSLYRALLKCIEKPEYLASIRPDPLSVKTIELDAEWMEKTYRELM